MKISAAEYRAMQKPSPKPVKATVTKPKKETPDTDTEELMGHNVYQEPETEHILTSLIVKADGYAICYDKDSIEVKNLKTSRRFKITVQPLA